MVERVALALRSVVTPEGTDPKKDWEAIGEGPRRMYRREAVTAIKAMREPTDLMICAVLDLHDSAPRTFRVSEDWRAMIDEALK